MKNIKKIISIASLLVISTSLFGCKNVSHENKNLLKKSYDWLNNNTFISKDNNDYTNYYYNDIKKPEEGSVFLEYQFYDKKLNKDTFNPILSLDAQSQMIKLLLNSNYNVKDAKLIGDNMINNLKTEKFDNNSDFYFIIPKKVYIDNKWQDYSSAINTEEQLNASYSLLLLYNNTKDNKYKEVGLQILNSQIKMSDKNSLVYEYVKNNKGLYEKNNIKLFSQIKSIYESCNLAYDITGDKKYQTFYSNNYKWVKDYIDSSSISYSGIKINGKSEILVNRKDNYFEENDMFNTEDYLETIVGLSYIDKEYSKDFKSLIDNMNYSDLSNNQTVLNYLKSNGKNFSSLDKTFDNNFNIYSSILRLEYYINIEDKNEIEKIFNSINSYIEYKINDTENVKGALCYNPSNCIINSKVTAYYLDLIYNYIIE